MSNFCLAKDLRNKAELAKIPGDKPGWYRWWASEKALKSLLNSPFIQKQYLDELLPHLKTHSWAGKTFFYVYVGIAVKESIRDRLNWHVNQRHAKSSVKSGFLSTLRQSISSLVAGDQSKKAATNHLIDELLIEYWALDYPIGSVNAKDAIEQIEQDELANNVLPLNIQDNRNPVVGDFLAELSKARSLSKAKGIAFFVNPSTPT